MQIIVKFNINTIHLVTASANVIIAHKTSISTPTPGSIQGIYSTHKYWNRGSLRDEPTEYLHTVFTRFTYRDPNGHTGVILWAERDGNCPRNYAENAEHAANTGMQKKIICANRGEKRNVLRH